MTVADASLPLQKAIVAALKGSAELAAIVGTRVYDKVPADAKKPYVSLGPEQVMPDLADEYEGAHDRFQVDGWSAERGRVEAKAIGAAIHAALHDAALTVDGHRLVNLQIEQTRYLVDADGITQHAVLIFTATTEPIA